MLIMLRIYRLPLSCGGISEYGQIVKQNQLIDIMVRAQYVGTILALREPGISTVQITMHVL